ncbi:hypothetical protein Pst134EA_021327 [Puccinia striiformis f. sp. tritici]|uniref:hypothetical protein n=1 Tax=Puccinia striiformis f. sp. tritici TaxID=168172 RepID=UPI0020087FE1|nr:hypothetical protein Pst134EA_021327 [Puccinia striiformis f. sp. tritici]KAH9457451.1 hypothetical protein Pst134EA_021327 [Puccinia striiformis f. sp. tritici]KAI9617670.1 hypothetical protein H4Q26_012973 [Puccinia striiformis f. sp. tritici PST-130]
MVNSYHRQLMRQSTIHFRKNYWTATTFRSSSASKVVQSLHQTISSYKTPPSTTTGPSILLFTISKRIPSTLLLDLVNDIQSLSDLLIEPIGCLTEDPQLGVFSASIAKWSNTTDSSESIVPFTSNIHSRTSISVGREIYPPSIDPSTHLDQYSGHAHHVAQESMDLPEELRGIQPNSIDSLIFFSSPSPQPFLASLQRNLTSSSANVIGLIGSSTTFETGRVSTLFRNRKILGNLDGAVGIAILKNSANSGSHRSPPLIQYNNFKTLGKPMKITEAQGNIILTLDSKKATKYLLEVIQKSELNHHQSSSSELMISKDKEFYLGFLDDHQQNKVVEVCRIIGGSVSRGTMALDREKEIQVNQSVQFIHSCETDDGQHINKSGPDENFGKDIKSSSSSTTSLSSTTEEEAKKKQKIAIEFECYDPLVSKQQREQALPKEKDGDVERIEGLFSGGSEAGFVPKHQQIVNLLNSKVTLSL